MYKKILRSALYLIGDGTIFFIAFLLAYSLRFNFNIPDEHLPYIFKITFAATTIKIFVFFLFDLYRISWRFFSFSDAKKIFIAITFSSIILLLYLKSPLFDGPAPRSIIIIDYFVSLLLIESFRSLYRTYISITSSIKKKKNNAAIIGITNNITDIINIAETTLDVKVTAIFSQKEHGDIKGVRIYNYKNLCKTILKKKITYLIVSSNVDQKILSDIVEKAKKCGIKSIEKYNPIEKKTKKISIEDLLARKPKDLDDKKIKEMIAGKTVMITGAGGSIGSEISKQVLKYKASKIILVDNSEYNLYKIAEEIPNHPHYLKSVANRKEIQEVFCQHKIDIVIHAAAYKHVPLCEENPESAIKNNIIGTKNIIDLSVNNNVKRVVLISTDKAVRPTNIMGATKRVCELYAQNKESKSTIITAVRFGNVLGSSGSIIPKFKKQIENNQPLTVTHKEITRYFMLIPEACQLVLQAASIAKNKELFVLDMGEPVKIYDLAKKMLKLYNKDLEIKITGLRPGEKLYEELLINENDKKTIYESIFVAEKTFYNIDKLNKEIKNLLKAKNKKTELKKIVPEFTPKNDS